MFAVWVKPDTVTGEHCVFSRGKINTDGYALIQSGATLYFETNQSGAQQVSSTGNVLAIGTWAFIIVARDGSSVKIYVDLVDRTTASGTHIAPDTSSRLFRIGSYDNSDNKFFDGLIDELRCFSEVKSELDFPKLMYERYSPKWLFQYSDGSKWVNLASTHISSIQLELSGHEEVSFTLPNTAANRAIVLSDKTVRLLYLSEDGDYQAVYTGTLKVTDYSATKLECVLYNSEYDAMQKQEFTGDFEATSAKLIMQTGYGGVMVGYKNSFFGNPMDGKYNYVLLNTKVYAAKVQMNAYTGSLVYYVGVRCRTLSSGKLKAAIYSDNNGTPGTLLESSTEYIVSGDEFVVYTIILSSLLAVDENKIYWLAVMVDGDVRVAMNYYSPYTQQVCAIGTQAYASGFPSTFTADSITQEFLNIKACNVWAVTNVICPETPVSVSFKNSKLFDMGVSIAKILDKDYYADPIFTIGTRNKCVLALPLNEGAGTTAQDVSGHGNHAEVV